MFRMKARCTFTPPNYRMPLGQDVGRRQADPESVTAPGFDIV